MDPSEPWTIDDEGCRSFVAAVEFAGKKWNAAILLALARGAHRFTEIRGLVDGVSDRLLSARLRELESHDLVDRAVTPTMPVQVRYELTPSGRELLQSLHALNLWKLRHGFAAPNPALEAPHAPSADPRSQPASA